MYVTKRVLRLTASPHSVAAGVAAGVFASFTPFMGFHFIIAFAVAYVIAGNFIAAALGTFVGNPLTFPVIWASTYTTGRFILSGATHSGNSDKVHDKLDDGLFAHGIKGVVDHISGLWEPLLKPMTVGGIPLGILAAIVFYLLTRQLAVSFRAARNRRLSGRREIVPIEMVAGDAEVSRDGRPAAAGEHLSMQSGDELPEDPRMERSA